MIRLGPAQRLRVLDQRDRREQAVEAGAGEKDRAALAEAANAQAGISR